MSIHLVSATNPLRPAAALALAGQVAHIGVTLLHAGGEANHHAEIFHVYAQDVAWPWVHAAQFAAMVLMHAGLAGLFLILAELHRPVRTLAQLGALGAGLSLALYAALQAVDGIALCQAVRAWEAAEAVAGSPTFAAAEAIRWLEWGMRSYQSMMLGITLLTLAAAVQISRLAPRVLALVIAASGAVAIAQGWFVGTEGFSASVSGSIILGWVTGLAGMVGVLFGAGNVGATSPAFAET